MNRRDKDNSKKTQSRGWYFKKTDWITISDEIEDEKNTDESIEEDKSKEEEAPIRTVSPVDGRNKVCPVCREEFSHFFEHGDGDQEEGWYLNNAMEHLEHKGTVYHPECFKDKDNTMDNSHLTPVKDEKEVEQKQETIAKEEPMAEEENCVPPIKTENVKKVTEAKTEPVSSIEVENAVQEPSKDVSALLDSLTKFDWSGHGINIQFW